jgi:hypothetical protein
VLERFATIRQSRGPHSPAICVSTHSVRS